MSEFVWIVLGVLGAFVGLYLPKMANQTAILKKKQKGSELVPNSSYLSFQLKIFCAVLNGIGWGLCAYFQDVSIALLCAVAIWTIGIVLIIVDVRIHIIPNEAVLIILVLGVMMQVSLFGMMSIISSVMLTVIIMVVLISVGNMVGLYKIGAGDVKLIGSMGMILGSDHIYAGLLAMAVSMLGFCLIGMAIKKITRQSMLAFAPFIVCGIMVGIVAMFMRV